MGIFDWFKKEQKISKSDLEEQIYCLDKLADILLNSETLGMTGMGRCEKMASIMYSYKNIFVHFYENEFKYGNSSKFISESEKARYILTSCSVLSDKHSRLMCLSQLPNNWKESLLPIKILMDDPLDGPKLKKISKTIDGITNSINIMSTYIKH